MQQSTHSRARAAADRLRQLKALRTVARLRLAADDVNRLIDQLGALGVMTLGPIVARTRRTEAHIVGLEQRAHRRGFDHIHNAWLEVDKAGAWNKAHSARLLIVHVNLIEARLIIALLRLALELAICLELVFGAHRVPERIADLVAALSDLHVHDLAHHGSCGCSEEEN